MINQDKIETPTELLLDHIADQLETLNKTLEKLLSAIQLIAIRTPPID